MAGASKIRHDMQVLGHDGGMIGKVDAVEGKVLKLQRAPELGGGEHHFVPLIWVERVDDHVHLNVAAATARDRFGTEASNAGHAAVPDDEGGIGWLPWLIGAIVLVAILFFALKGLFSL